MSLPQLRLDNQLCFLFHRISRELDAAYRPLLAELGLTYSQYLVMLVLWEGDGLGVGELGNRLQLDSGTLSPLLRRLERGGLVRRERSASDERRVTIELTDRGRNLRDRAAGIPGAIARCLVDDAVRYTEMHAQLISLAARIARSRPAASLGDPVAAGAGAVTGTQEPDR